MKNKAWRTAVALGTMAFVFTTTTAPTFAQSKPNTSTISLQQDMRQPRIGIVSPMGMEQAPVLAEMKVSRHVVIDGYTFYMGTIGGKAVVDVRSGEKEYAAEFATMLLDSHFNITANLMPGTAGSRNVNVHLGDVVLGAYNVDKSSIHYQSNGSETPYTGEEILVNANSLTKNGVNGGYGQVGPTPSDAASYGSGPSATTKSYVYYEALPGSAEMLKVGLKASLGTVSLSDVTGNAKEQGNRKSVVMSGVIGSANQWTEPLVWMEDQNALYQTDAGENEGMGFTYVNAQLGIPSLVVRGISDSPWYPNAYDGVLAADRAAQVAAYIIEHMPASAALRKTANMALLSPKSNAKENGYLVASRVFYAPGGTVTKIEYLNSNGKKVTIKNPSETTYQTSSN